MEHLALDFAIVFGVAAVTSVIFRRLGQPSILGYLFAGLVVGPYIPIPIFADSERISALSELGVVLVMFGVGLEFTLRKLLRVLPLAGFTAIVQIASLGVLGFAFAQLIGLSQLDALFLGSCISISSTMVVAKVFDEHPPSARVRELVLGVLVVQDLAAIVLVAVLTGVAAGAGLSPHSLGQTLGNLALVLVLMVVVGLFVVPRFVRYLARFENTEVLLVGVTAVCFCLASLAEHLGYSVALGAFLAGTLVAEAGRTHAIEELIHPVRDLFAAVFFVSVGMSVDPMVAVAYLDLGIGVAALVIVGQFLAVGIAGVLSGNGVRRSITAGLALGQIGEFAFILAAIGAAAGIVGDYLRPVVVTVAVITAFTTPLLVRLSDRIARKVEHKLPRPLQTFASLCESWFLALRRASATQDNRSHFRNSVIVISVDTAAIASLWVLLGWWHQELVELLVQWGLSESLAIVALECSGLVLTLPVFVVLLRSARRAGQLLSERVIPPVSGKADLGLAPRRAMIVTLQIMVVSVASAPIVVVMAPLSELRYGLFGLVGVALWLVVYLWRSASDLQGHVRAGSAALGDLLKQQMTDDQQMALKPAALLPGLGTIRSVSIDGGAAACHRTLAQLDLRAVTGATVVAIVRDGQTLAMPHAHDQLCPGDTVALAGASHAVEAAIAFLQVRTPAELEPGDAAT